MEEKAYSDLTPEELRQKDLTLADSYKQRACTGSDLARHILELTNMAFEKGDRAAIAILEHWALAAPTGDAHHSAWALYSMLRTGFLGTTLRVFLQCTGSPAGRIALRQLTCQTIISPDVMEIMSVDLPAPALKVCEELLSGRRPWLAEEELKKELDAIFMDYFARRSKEDGGGWD